MEHFSDRLRHVRKLRKFSQAELARISGLSQGAISSYETRTRQATTAIMQLSQALDVSPVWLLTGTGPMDSMPPLPTYALTREIRDFERKATTVTWPFETIQPDEFWALTEPQRRIVEQTIATLIAAFHHERGNIQK